MTFDSKMSENEIQHCQRALRSLGSTLRFNFEIEPPIAHILRMCRNTCKLSTRSETRLITLVKGSIDRMIEKINLGNWKDVPLTERQTITMLSFYQVLLCINANKMTEYITLVPKMFEIIDKGLLFGAPLQPPHADLLHKCASLIKSNNQSKFDFNKPTTFSQLKHHKIVLNNLQCGKPIDLAICPAIDTFYNGYMKKKFPVVLQNTISNWPALSLWDTPEYLFEKVGHRIVPVELGSKYTDSNWTQKLMSVSDFINDYILKDVSDNSCRGYLAQHQLFDQIPELLEDFKIPDYCSLHDEDISDDIDVNAWFGPAGTISPLHTDPKHNLLSQVVGEKLVVLFSPHDDPYLYCHNDNLLQNTAQVDPMKPDFEKFPEFKKAVPYFHILKPGEVLYIPPKWWHYVHSLSVSFSVSFWWN